MPQKRLGNEEFLNHLTTLLTNTNTSQHGSVFLTQKPLPSAEPTSSSPTTPQILIRATNGATLPPSKTKSKSKAPVSKITKQHSIKERIKLATVVDVADLEGFYAKYAEVCKKGMEGLRKRDKKKAKAKKKGKKTA